MRTDKVLVIARREYLSRIKTKGFWIGTVLLPLLMLALTVLPGLLLSKLKGTLRVAVVDETGRIGGPLAERLPRVQPAAGDGERDRNPEASAIQVELVPAADDEAEQRAALDRRILAEEIDAWVWISAEGLETRGERHHGVVEYHGESVSNFITQEILEDAISDVVREWRLTANGFDAARVAELSRGVSLETTRVSAAGSQVQTGMAGFFFAYFLFFLLYMVLMIYGQQVMSGVLEEKTSRIVEVIIATVRPLELMAGKLLGICLVALTQLGIWLGTAFVLTMPGLVAAAAMLPQVSLPLVLHFLGFFVLGFLIYATYYAALGAAFNDIKEAQQAASSAAFLFVPVVLFMFPTINDPDSLVATAASLFPPFTPLLMVLRVAVKSPPAWQLALGYVLSAAFVVFMVWVCGKIYRTGILMYGKKPTLRELVRWVRYA
jgi:ABC-2 type transport system permease protein